MSYRDELLKAMEVLAQDPQVCFVGYNLCPAGGSAGGSIKGVPAEKIFEMPLAENLMAGAAIGLSLDGRIPVLWFERMDFLLCGLDALVNHLNQISTLSEGVHKPAVIIRVCVGNRNAPLFTGPTHVQDFTETVKKMVSFNVVPLIHTETIKTHYRYALGAARNGVSTMLVEYKDRYLQE